MNDRRIENVVIIGMGALGLMFGQRIAQKPEEADLCFLMDPERKRRHAGERVLINGSEMSVRMVEPDEIRAPADLVIVATKYGGLYGARDLMHCAVGPDTVIISLLNGISSEDILAEVFQREQIPDCIAIGMDAVRSGSSLTYRNIGRLQIGMSHAGQETALARLQDFLERADIPYELCGDIRKAMWNKFMINVGINQTCMVYEITYGEATAEGSQALKNMSEAMREVIRIAAAEGIGLTEEDYVRDVALLRTLNPEGYPSMRQDALAKRPSEVDLFAGTVIEIAGRHGIEVPVNERYYQIIKKMEQEYE